MISTTRQHVKQKRQRGHSNPIYMENVKRYMTRHNISVAGLSRTSGVSYAHLLRIISGHYRPQLATCSRIAKGLGIELQELIAMINIPVANTTSNRQQHQQQHQQKDNHV